MFENIGKKLMSLAEIICWIGIIGSVITGIVLMSLDAVGIGLLIMAGGALFSWIGSFAMYGFGQLIEDTGTIRARLERTVDAAAEGASVVDEELPDL